jgi:hypothetical protein
MPRKRSPVKKALRGKKPRALTVKGGTPSKLQREQYKSLKGTIFGKKKRKKKSVSVKQVSREQLIESFALKDLSKESDVNQLKAVARKLFPEKTLESFIERKNFYWEVFDKNLEKRFPLQKKWRELTEKGLSPETIFKILSESVKGKTPTERNKAVVRQFEQLEKYAEKARTQILRLVREDSMF